MNKTCSFAYTYSYSHSFTDARTNTNTYNNLPLRKTVLIRGLRPSLVKRSMVIFFRWNRSDKSVHQLSSVG
jgi:hypothetical protein